MRTIFTCLLLTIISLVIAQTDSSDYVITMKDGTVFKCRIVDVKKGKAICVRKDDDSVAVIQWGSFLDYKKINAGGKANNLEAVGGKEEKVVNNYVQQVESLKKKHADWIACFVIKNSGDTIRGRTKRRDDYSSNGVNRIIIALKDESELKFTPEDVKELDIPKEEAGHQKYITLEGNTIFADPGLKKLYRVIMDGKCKLLYDMSVPPTATTTGTGEALKEGSLPSTWERFYIYYKNYLTMVKMDDRFTITAAFRKSCKDVFGECPYLVKNIEDKTFYTDDLRDMVQEFNRCIKSNKK